MPTLSSALSREPFLVLTGPYGTEIAERDARHVAASPHIGSGILRIRHLGAGCSALLTRDGQTYVHTLSDEYLASIPREQAIILAVNSFRLPKEVLESAAREPAINSGLPAKGLDLMLTATSIAEESVARSGRSRENTLIAASIGPPFDCYKGEDTPTDIAGKYAPQVFATVRFCPSVDYLMFETVPSYAAAFGAAQAFTQAHQALDVHASTDSFQNSDTLVYLGDTLMNMQRFGDIGTFVPSYDPGTGVFRAIEPTKEYLISLCLEKDGRLHDGRQQGGRTIDLDEALGRFDEGVEAAGLYAPVGFGINCNSPDVTARALETLPDRIKGRFIAIHPNASSRQDPRTYADISVTEAIPDGEYAAQVAQIAKDHGLKIVGGCCGTHPGTMSALCSALTAPGLCPKNS